MTATKNRSGKVFSNDHWDLYEEVTDFYGNDIPVSFARPRQGHSDKEDRTEFPQIYHDCDIYRMDWNCYSIDMTAPKRIAFSFFNEFEKWAEEGKGLYLWSKTPGSGKTFLSACIAKSVMLRTQKLVKYITPTDYMDKVSDKYNAKDAYYDPAKKYRECSLLVLDDLGTQLKSDWHNSEIFRLIDRRSSNGLPTIITSNYAPEQLPVDERTRNRIMKASIVLHMPEESIRSKKAAAEQDKYLNKILGGMSNESK